MRTIEEHLERILSSLTPVGVEECELLSAVNRVARAEVTSSIDLPPWPNSAMDGYAVFSDDLSDASEETPLTLPVLADIPAGDTRTHALESGQAMRIMTGAPVPVGCTAVVPVEKTAGWSAEAPSAGVEAPREVTFVAPIAEGANIRARGEDTQPGHVVITNGQLLSPSAIAAAAAIGAAALTVARRIRVAIISTGTELASLGRGLALGEIYDSNGPLLATLCAGPGAEVVYRNRVADDPELLREAVRDAQAQAEVIILTGGASVGAYDATREVLDRAHGTSELHRVEFTSVAMQPGKPQGFGVLEDGTYVWALPGNPVSVWVSFHLFIEPALRALAGRADIHPHWQPAVASQSWRSPQGREQLMPAVVTSASGEPLTVAPASTRGSGSHLAATLAQATAIVRIPSDTDEVHAGDTVLMRGVLR